MNISYKSVGKQIPAFRMKTPRSDSAPMRRTNYYRSSVARQASELEPSISPSTVNSPPVGGRAPLVVFTSKSRVFLRRLNATDVKTSPGGETSADAARDEQRVTEGKKDHLAPPLSPPAVAAAAAAGSRLPSLRLPLPPPPSPPQQERPASPWRGYQTFCQRRGREGLIKGG